MGYQLITAPTVEPVSLADVKDHLREEVVVSDALIDLMITSVREYCEQLTGRSLVLQQWALVMDGFYDLPGNMVQLEKGPVQSIDSITYIDMGGATQTWPASEYAADLSGLVVRITPRFGKIWPITLPQIATATVNFTAGYGAAGVTAANSAAAVPEGIKSWMKLRIGAMYENREEVISGRSISVTAMPFADRLLDAYTIFRA